MSHNASSTLESQKKVEICLRKSLDKNYRSAIIDNEEVVNGKRSNSSVKLAKLVGTNDKRYNHHLTGITEDILKIHGLTTKHIDVVSRFEDELHNEAGITDDSIDANANKSFRTIRAILSEVSAGPQKLIGYRYLYREMNKLYGTKRAQELMGKLYDYSLAMNDSTNILIPYCFAMDASSIITTGRQFGQLHSGPVHHLHSYIAVLNEVAHSFTNQIAGALAVGTLFFDVAYVMNNLENVPLNVLKENPEYKACYKDNITGEEKEVKFSTIRKYVENEFQSFVFSMNSLSRVTYESPFTNVSIFSPSKIKKLLTDKGREWYLENTDIPGNPDASDEEKLNYMVDYILEIQNIFMDFFDKGDPLNGGINYRFPVVTINVSKEPIDDGKKFKIVDDDKEFVEGLSHREIYRYNNMISLGTKIASCCRLITNVDDLNQFGAQVNSFGGSATSYGSHRVVTINFPRVAVECKSIKDFIDIECERIHDSVQVLHAHRSLLKTTCSPKLHPFFANGWIHMNRLFSTIGVIGITEAVDIIIAKIKAGVVENTTPYKINKSLPKADLERNLKLLSDYLKTEILTTLNDKMHYYSEKTEYRNPFNIEEIPGETMAVRLCEADKIIFGEDVIPYELYSNQFIPLWENASVWERMEADGKYNQLFTGGGIVHFNLNERPTPEQVLELYNYSVETGCEHFALNPIYALCENGHCTFGNVDTCPECGGKVKEKYTRVVGFFTPISSWNKVRREWEFPRRNFAAVQEKPFKNIKSI